MKRYFWKVFFDANPPGGGGGGGQTEEEILLGKIKGIIAEQTRGLPNSEAIQTAITTTLTGLNLEALRKYEGDKTALELNIRNLTVEFEKVKKAAQAGAAGPQFRTAPLKELLEKNMDEIAKVFRNKGQSGQVVTLNTRAAAVMTMDTAIDVSAVVIPEDIIESFSIDGFVKKRRPTEYIYEIANRRTVAEITEYKTWLEEGDEQGAFAVIGEGIVKPLVSKGLVRNISKYRKIAGKRIYTEEFAKFRKEAYNIIEDLFNDQLLRDYAAVLVTTLLTKAASYVATALDGQYTNPTDYHAIGAVAAQAESIDFMPDLLIINPQDKWRIGLQQNDQGTFYMPVPVYNPSGLVTMMGFRVYTSNRMPVGNAILGEAGLYKIEDEPVQIRLGYGINVTKDGNGFVTDVSSDVDNNRFRIIAETFFHNYIATNYTGSFTYFNFADVKASLLAPAV